MVIVQNGSRGNITLTQTMLRIGGNLKCSLEHIFYLYSTYIMSLVFDKRLVRLMDNWDIILIVPTCSRSRKGARVCDARQDMLADNACRCQDTDNCSDVYKETLRADNTQYKRNSYTAGDWCMGGENKLILTSVDRAFLLNPPFLVYWKCVQHAALLV